VNIWSWVHPRLRELETDEPRLVRLLENLARWTTDGQHDRLDAAWPEIRAGIERLGDPWLEVFARHWHLQSLVLHRLDSKRGLPLAIDLLERSSRPDARDCPQSVCVAQDVCSAYGQRDGPAYAEERLGVSLETLARIDPSWPCFTCISAEAAGALLDAGRPDEAVAFVRDTHAAIRTAGFTDDGSDLVLTHAAALLQLGRPEESLAALEKADLASGRGGETFAVKSRIGEARALLHLGRLDEALERFPTVDRLGTEAEAWQPWSAVFEDLVLGDHRAFEAADRRRFLGWARTFRQREYLRGAFDLLLRVTRLDLHSGSPARAGRALDAARDAATRLHADMGAAATLQTLSDQLASATAAPEAQPDAALATVEAAPDDLDALRTASASWAAWGEPEAGWTLVADHPDRHGTFLLRCSLSIDLDDTDRLEAVLDGAPRDVPAEPVAWYRSVVAERRNDLVRAAMALEGHDAAGLVRRRSGLLRRLDRHAEALAALQAIPDELVEPPIRWERIELASLVGDHEVVRSEGAALGITFHSDEGPVDEDWGWVRLQLGADLAWALRTGPATVRILEPRGCDPEQVDDVWVVDTAPVAREPDLLFRGLSRIAEGGWLSTKVDGFLPDGGYDAVRGALEPAGFKVWFHSGDAYRLTRPEGVDDGPEEGPGVYFTLLFREGSEAAAVEALSALPTPWLVYPELHDRLGQGDEADAQRARARRWSL
jgi:tetratricopeptide (TPR) repeat protein